MSLLPLRKNCCPPAKNLAPLTDILGKEAAACATKQASKVKTNAFNMVGVVVEYRTGPENSRLSKSSKADVWWCGIWDQCNEL
jgi:hypothetical protein